MRPVDRFLCCLYLAMAKTLKRRPSVAFTEVLKGPRNILLHLPPGPGEAWFAVPAIKSLRSHYPDSQFSFLLHDERETLLEEELGRLIRYGRLTPLSRPFVETGRILRGRPFDIFLDLSRVGGLAPLILATLTRADMRVGHSRKRGLPFFNCQILNGEGDEIERNLQFLERLGVEREEEEPLVLLRRADRREAKEYLESKGYRARETLLGMDLAKRARGWGVRGLARLLKKIDTEFHPRFLIASSPWNERMRRVLRSLEKEPIFLEERSLHEMAGILSYCKVFITRKTDLLPVAYGLRVPTILVLSKREANCFYPPERDWLKAIELRSRWVPMEEICDMVRQWLCRGDQKS